MAHLSSDLLRTFLAIAETGSVTAGAQRVHKSQSAVSLQLQRLENLLGKPAFDRHGRGVQLNETGRRLLPTAQRVISQLDAAYDEIAGPRIVGKIRLGIPDDHGRATLAQIIAAFAQDHPQVELEVTCALGTTLPDALEDGRLDLAVYEVREAGADEQILYEDPTCWVSSARRDFADHSTLPVALFDHSCWWREAALSGLEKRSGPYRIAFSSQSVVGVMAAVEAGIGVGLIGRSSLEDGMSVVTQDLGFESPPTSKLVLKGASGESGAPVAALRSAIRNAFALN